MPPTDEDSSERQSMLLRHLFPSEEVEDTRLLCDKNLDIIYSTLCEQDDPVGKLNSFMTVISMTPKELLDYLGELDFGSRCSVLSILQANATAGMQATLLRADIFMRQGC